MTDGTPFARTDFSAKTGSSKRVFASRSPRAARSRATGTSAWQATLLVLNGLMIAAPADAVAQLPGSRSQELIVNPHIGLGFRDRIDPRSDRRRIVNASIDVRDGGARPSILPLPPPKVGFPYEFTPGSIVISVAERRLYYVLPDQQAYQYDIGVGRDGFGWTGVEIVSRKQAWPDWYPPEEMRERDPTLPEKMTGGIKNPLGAIALYLGDTLYRIHGTNDATSIGRAESSGCFRMLNSSVVHLGAITQIGTPVNVLRTLPTVEVSHAPARKPQPEPVQTSPATAPLEGKSSLLAPDYRALRNQTLRTK